MFSIIKEFVQYQKLAEVKRLFEKDEDIRALYFKLATKRIYGTVSKQANNLQSLVLRDADGFTLIHLKVCRSQPLLALSIDQFEKMYDPTGSATPHGWYSFMAGVLSRDSKIGFGAIELDAGSNPILQIVFPLQWSDLNKKGLLGLSTYLAQTCPKDVEKILATLYDDVADQMAIAEEFAGPGLEEGDAGLESVS